MRPTVRLPGSRRAAPPLVTCERRARWQQGAKAPPGDTSTSRNAEKGRRFGLAVRPAATRRSARAPNAFREHRRGRVERARGCIALLAHAVPKDGLEEGEKILGPATAPRTRRSVVTRRWCRRNRLRPTRYVHPPGEAMRPTRSQRSSARARASAAISCPSSRSPAARVNVATRRGHSFRYHSSKSHAEPGSNTVTNRTSHQSPGTFSGRDRRSFFDKGVWRTSNNAHGRTLSTLGGGGSRTRVSRALSGTSPSAADDWFRASCRASALCSRPILV